MQHLGFDACNMESFATQDFSLAQQKGFFLQPGGLKRLKALEDCVNHQHVLGFTPGGIETVNSLSRYMLVPAACA